MRNILIFGILFFGFKGSNKVLLRLLGHWSINFFGYQKFPFFLFYLNFGLRDLRLNVLIGNFIIDNLNSSLEYKR